MGSSLRKLRRAQERRDAAYAKDMQSRSDAERMRVLYKNGITAKDVDDAFREGWDGAKKEVEEFCFHTIYAAILIELVEGLGLDPDKAREVLKAIDKKVVLCVEDKDLMNEAYERADTLFVWDDPIERVK